MFADNRKISLRQISRWMILDLFGLSSLLLPGILAEMTGADGIICLLLGMCGGMVLLRLIQWNLKDMKRSYAIYMQESVGALFTDIFMVFYLMYFVVLAGYVLYQLNLLVLSWLLPKGSYRLIELFLLLLAAYGTIGGIEGRARIYEIIFWFLGMSLLFMLIMAMSLVHTDRWTPFLWTDGNLYIDNSVRVYLFLMPLAGLLFLKPFCQKQEKVARCGKTAVLSVTVVQVVIYLMLTGTFGQNTVQVLKRPVITLMSLVKLPGGFLPRADIIMTAVWFFALFALLHTGIFQGTLILQELCHEQKNRYSLLVVLVLVFLTGNSFMEHYFMEELFEAYQRVIVLPGMIGILVLVPFAFRIRGYFNKRKGGKEQCENMQQP